jgi:hypothetical protein
MYMKMMNHRFLFDVVLPIAQFSQAAHTAAAAPSGSSFLLHRQGPALPAAQHPTSGTCSITTPPLWVPATVKTSMPCTTTSSSSSSSSSVRPPYTTTSSSST